MTGGAPATLTGNASTIDNSAPIGAQGVSAGYAYSVQPGAFSITAPGTDTPAQALARSGLYLGNSSQTITVPDAINGGSTTFSVVPTASFRECPMTCTPVALYTAANGTEYINTRLGQVDSTGGTLNIAINGDGLAPLRSMPTKQSSLFFANGTGATPSALNFTGNNLRLDLTSAYLDTSAMVPGSLGSNIVTYIGTLVYDASHTFRITNITDLKSYNDFLITQLQSGALLPNQYAGKLSLGYLLENSQLRYSAGGGIATTDQLFIVPGLVSVLHVTGTNGLATVTSGASLTIQGATVGVLFAENGATVTNAGQLNILGSGNGSTGAGNGIGMNITSGSHGFNTGVLNAGFDAAGATPSIVTNVGAGYGVGVSGGSSFVNTGIINSAAASQGDFYQDTFAINVNNAGSTGINNGVINVAVNAGPLRYRTDYGVIAGDSGSFINNGTIYVGRGPQYNTITPELTADVAAQTVVRAVYVSGGASAINNGTLTIGTLAENALGMSAFSSGNTLINSASGVINVNGNAGNAANPPGQNVGMVVQDGGSSTVLNAGTINLAGKNGIGLQVLATSVSSLASSSGTINVAGGADPATALRNYGIWADGTNFTATANLSGQVNLTGDNAIGVHARNNAVINVTGGGGVNFNGGTNQIGFYIYGAAASVNAAGAVVDVATAGSTGFRLAAGAQFTGTGLNLNANGVGSTAVFGTGVGTTVDTTGATFDVNASGAKAVLIEGGATGNISAATTINLNVAGALAGVVDGQAHDLSGVALGTPVAGTQLTAATILQGSANNVTGYITRNLGVLHNSGNMVMNGTDSVGIDVQQGGRLDNTGTLTVGGGVGIRASGSDAQITRLGTIVVNGGIAAVQLLNGAALTANGLDSITTNGTANGILLDIGTTTVGTSIAGPAASLDLSNLSITANGTGAGIENKAEIGTVLLNSVTINVGNGPAIRTATSFNPASSGNILNVTGSGVGIAFQDFTTSGNVSSDLTVGSGYTVNVSGANGVGVRARTTGNVTMASTVNVTNVAGGAALEALDAAIVTNTGTLNAALSTGVAILTGAVANTINLSGGAVRGLVNTGDGADTVNWTAGTLNGEINLGAGNGNTALIGAVNYANTRHVMADDGTTGNNLVFSGTTTGLGFGSLGADDVTRGLNIGANFNNITLQNGADQRVIGNLAMQSAASTLVVADTASTLRVGGNGASAGSVLNRSIANNGTVIFDNLDAQSYSGVMSGTGNFTRATTGATTLIGANTYSGTTTVAGMLVAGAANTFSPASVHNVAATGVMDLAGFNQSIAGLSNAGIVRLSSAGASTQLTVTGPLVGNGGTVIFGATLGNDTSPIDQIILSGATAVASGTTNLLVENRGGLGAATTGAGIPVIVMQNGANSTASAFVLANTGGHVDAGAFQYRLYEGDTSVAKRLALPDAAGVAKSFYLRTDALPTVPTPAPTPSSVPSYREEVALLSAKPEVMRQSDLTMLSNLHRRMGDDDAKAKSVTLATSQPAVVQRRSWARVIYSDINVQQSGTVDPHTQGRLSGVQAGVDLFAAPATTTDDWRAGIYVGSLDGELNIDGNAGGQYGRVGGTSTSSRFLSLYGTYLGQDGLYADAVLQYGRHSYTTTTLSNNSNANGKGSSYSASLEVGKAFALNERWSLEPQGQLIRQNVGVDDLTISGATTVHQDAADVWIGRLGVRIKGDMTSVAGPMQPYGRFNIYRSSGGTDTARFTTQSASTSITAKTGYTSGELAAGVTLKLTTAVSVYGEFGKVFKLGGGDTQVKSSVQGSVGVKMAF